MGVGVLGMGCICKDRWGFEAPVKIFHRFEWDRCPSCSIYMILLSLSLAMAILRVGLAMMLPSPVALPLCSPLSLGLPKSSVQYHPETSFITACRWCRGPDKNGGIGITSVRAGIVAFLFGLLIVKLEACRVRKPSAIHGFSPKNRNVRFALAN